MFGEKGKFIISGGNDKSVKVWDWSKYYDAGGATSNGDGLLCSNISLSRKVSKIFKLFFFSSLIWCF